MQRCNETPTTFTKSGIPFLICKVTTSMDSKAELKKRLCELNQESVLNQLDSEEKMNNFLSDVQSFDSVYPGHIDAYLGKMKTLLMQSANKENPMDGWIPEVPSVLSVEFNTPEYYKLEKEGLNHLMETGFILVAGGLGERLGYNNIKVSLPVETFTMIPYLGYYIKKILAIQHRIPSEKQHRIPLAIMTSDNNNDITVKFLQDNDYFGMDPSQVFIMKQDVVPSVKNLQCELATESNGHLIKKPHGHGDVHFCLYRDGIVKKWMEEFHIQYLFFFQDTNALSFYTMTCTAALAVQQNAFMVSTCVQRKPHEASGALCHLKHKDGRELLCNVEYNQLEDVIKTIDERGDFADESGYSPFPGNSNILFFRASEYYKLLSLSQGLVPEFVNPKYKPGSRSEYLQPARLESMMQDYPKLLLQYPDAGIRGNHVIVSYPRFLAWSPVKNAPARAKEQEAKTGNPESAASGEADQLRLYRELLLSVNTCPVCNPAGEQRVIMEDGAYVVFSAECGCTTEEIHQHIGKDVVLKAGSILIVNCRNWKLDNVVVDGVLILNGSETSEVYLKNVVINNKGWHYVFISHNDANYSVIFQMRGHIVERIEQCVLSVNAPGMCVIENEHFTSSCVIEK